VTYQGQSTPPSLIIHKHLNNSVELLGLHPVMEKNLSDSLDFHVCQTINICDNTLDNAELETWCPLDNGQHNYKPIFMSLPANQLDRLPLELLIKVLLQMDIPLLTCFSRPQLLHNGACQLGPPKHPNH